MEKIFKVGDKVSYNVSSGKKIGVINDIRIIDVVGWGKTKVAELSGYRLLVPLEYLAIVDGCDDLFLSECTFSFVKGIGTFLIQFERMELNRWSYNIFDDGNIPPNGDIPVFMGDCHEKTEYPDIVLAYNLLMNYFLSL